MRRVALKCRRFVALRQNKPAQSGRLGGGQGCSRAPSRRSARLLAARSVPPPGLPATFNRTPERELFPRLASPAPARLESRSPAAKGFAPPATLARLAAVSALRLNRDEPH